MKPKPAHKLNLQPGDVIRLERWESGRTTSIGVLYTVNHDCTKATDSHGFDCPPSGRFPKGERPLFTVVSRAKPVAAMGEIVLTASPECRSFVISSVLSSSDTHRLTFPTADGVLIPGTYTGPDGAQIKIEVIE